MCKVPTARFCGSHGMAAGRAQRELQLRMRMRRQSTKRPIVPDAQLEMARGTIRGKPTGA